MKPAIPLVFIVACTGRIQAGVSDDAPPHTGDGRSAETPVTGAPTASPAPGGAAAPAPGGQPDAPAAIDPGAPFACAANARGATTARLWRLSALQYDNTVKTLAGAIDGNSYTNPFDGIPSGERFPNYADPFGMPSATTDTALVSGHDIAALLVPKLQAATPCLKAPDATCWRSVATSLGARAFRRPLTADEVTRYATLAANSQGDLGPDSALSLVVQALLASPNFLFRSELGEGPVDAAGRRRLGPYETASAIAYTLTDAPPDSMLAAAAAAGQLANAEQVRAHVTRLLGKGGDNKVVQRFFRDLFFYDRAPTVFKDPNKFSFWSFAGEIVTDTDRFVSDVASGPDFLKTLLTADWGYLRRETAQNFYGVAGITSDTPARTTFPAGQRAGILTQPSFLAAFSTPTDNNPVTRGKFIAQTLLCQALPNAPGIAVPPLPDTASQTLRQRLELHRQTPGCAVCHRLMDPLGLPLEGYDHLGRYRTTELGKPVDTGGALQGSGNGDGAVTDAGDLSRRLARSPVVERCFVRQSFRYLMGRSEGPADECALAAGLDGSMSGDLRALVTALLTSDSFLYRTQEAAP